MRILLLYYKQSINKPSCELCLKYIYKHITNIYACASIYIFNLTYSAIVNVNYMYVLLVDQRLDMKNPEKPHVITTSLSVERRHPEGADLRLRGLLHISLHEVLHIQILVHEVCPSAEMVLLCMMKANGVVVILYI